MTVATEPLMPRCPWSLVPECPIQPALSPIVHWHQVNGEPSVLRLPPEVLETICSYLSNSDLLNMRLVHKAWRDIPAAAVQDVDISCRQYAATLPQTMKNMSQFFPNVTAVTLSCMDSLATPGCLPSGTLAFDWVAASLVDLTQLTRLVLSDAPLVPTTLVSLGLRLPCLSTLQHITSLDIRLQNCLPGGGPSTVQSAQDFFLRGLASLTHLTHLSLKLVDLPAAPLPVLHTPSSSASTGSLWLSESESDDGSEILVDGGLHDMGEPGGPGWQVHALDQVDLDYEEPFPTCHDAPSITCFQALARHGCSLLRLEIANVALRHEPLAELLECLPQLTALHLSGQLGLDGDGIHAIRAMRDLRELGLSKVQLIYSRLSHEDCEDCPETLMGRLCDALEGLPHFTHLRFEVADMDMTRFMHTAYLLGLYGHNQLAAQLRSIQLGIVIFDSDHSVGILASLSNLRSLKVEFQTWPLSLQSRDLTQLSCLSKLTCLDLMAHEQEAHHLLVLSRQVVAGLAAGLTALKRFHFAGLIDFDGPSCPELAAWSSIQDLTLVNMVDESEDKCQGSSCGGGAGGDGSGAGQQNQRAGNTESSSRAACDRSRGPRWLCDEEAGRSGNTSRGRILLDLKHSLPPGLCKLSLTHVHIRQEDMAHIASDLPKLHTLQLSECGVSPLHLLVLADAPSPPALEVLVLYDIPYQDCIVDGLPDEQCQMPWWAADAQAVSRAALSLLGKRLGCLEYLMLSLPGGYCAHGCKPIDRTSAGCAPEVTCLSCEEVLGPLCSLSRLKALTMQAYGCCWNQAEVVGLMQGRLQAARILNVRWKGGQLQLNKEEAPPYLRLP